MSKRIVITGATGNLGAYTATWLNEKGYEVIACGKRESDNGFFTEKGMQYVSIDICDKLCFKRLPTKNVDAILHFAGELPSRYNFNPEKLIESIVIGTLNVLEYVKNVGVKQIVFPQTPFDIWYKHNTAEPIYADDVRSFPPTGDHSVYTIAKNAAIDLIEHYHNLCGFSRFILRHFTIYEYNPNPNHYVNGTYKMMPYRILMEKAMNSEPIEIWGNPSFQKEMVYIKDFCQIIQCCLESNKEGGIYNVGGSLVSLDEQIKGIVKVFSPKDNKSKISYRPDMANALQAHFDITKTSAELKYKPRFSYLDSLIDFKKEMELNRFEKLWGKEEKYKH